MCMFSLQAGLPLSVINNIKEGDIWVFELVDRLEMVARVLLWKCANICCINVYSGFSKVKETSMV